MQIELAQECDYVREAECCRLMRKHLMPYHQYYVPQVIDDLSGSQVYTSEFINGLTIDECAALDQETRNDIVMNFLILLFTELFQFRYMQTDPNWANFLYNPETRQVLSCSVLWRARSKRYSQSKKHPRTLKSRIYFFENKSVVTSSI